jgi:hypothetical protein
MSRTRRWILSIATGVAALPAGIAASELLCGPSQLGALFALTNALSLIP